MLRKIEDILEVIFVGLLTFLPLIFYAVQKITSVQVPGSEYGIAQLVFLFACMAGVITWRENRHLSLASFSGKLPPHIRKVTDSIANGATVFVLTMLFLNSICQLLNPGQFTMTVWKIPVKVLFVFLPLCYALMLYMV
ncbi:MAG: TRAP transporter small permease subunit, partial [Treponema sp.]|nr:TRAP transporter small permease subunit [Treponema sp.]